MDKQIKKSEVKATIGAQVSLERKEQLQKEAKSKGLTLSRYLLFLLDNYAELTKKINEQLAPGDTPGLSEQDLDHIETRFSVSINSALDKHLGRREFKEPMKKHKSKGIQTPEPLVYKLIAANGTNLDDKEQVDMAKEFFESDFTFDQLMEYLCADDYVHYNDKQFLKGNHFKFLPFELSKNNRELFVKFIDWMIANGKAADAECVLLGNTISYLETGINNWGQDAEQTKLFLERFKSAANELLEELELKNLKEVENAE